MPRLYLRGFCWGVHIKTTSKSSSFHFGHGSRLMNVRIRSAGIGTKVTVNSRTIIRGTGVDIICEDSGSSITIGESCDLSGPTHIAATEGGNINIGDFCAFAPNVTIRNGDSHSIFNVEGVRCNLPSDVHIGNHVWLCDGVTVLKGSSIASNVVVGTKSLVLGALPSAYVAVGIPARPIKKISRWTSSRHV